MENDQIVMKRYLATNSIERLTFFLCLMNLAYWTPHFLYPQTSLSNIT